ncbi:MAG: NAD(P)-dependent oxidoreductase [Hylemonella sp.]|nr:NAD(P)-dependent oxidoreductase [Hylemonella sp.]
MRKIIVTGASGLVGSHLVAALSHADEVHALSRSKIVPTNSNTTWHAVDLDSEVDYSSLPQDADALIYLAQSDHFRDFPAKALEIFQVNTVQVLRALDFARTTGIKNFVFASSGGVYGFPEKGVSEDVTIPASGNLGFYLSTKLCAEILAENYAPFMDVVILRFFFVYGAGQKRSMLIPRLVDNIRDGKAITLQGEDGIRINPVHVSDAVRATQAALNLHGCHRINVAGPAVVSLREICYTIGSKVGVQPIFQINRSASPGNLIADTESMKKMLCAPDTKFADGIRDLIRES